MRNNAHAAHGHPTDPYPLVGAFHRLAAANRRHMVDLMRKETWLADIGFRPPCVGVMATIAFREPISQRELSDELRLDPSDLVGVVDVLERAGFVERNRDPKDRRRYALSLTPEGRKAQARLQEVTTEALHRTLAGLDEHERETLKGLLVRAIERHPVPAPDDE